MRPREHLRGIVVADDLFGLGVPANRTAETDSDIAEVADRRAPVADGDIGDRAFAALDTVEEILMVILAHFQMHVRG